MHDPSKKRQPCMLLTTSRWVRFWTSASLRRSLTLARAGVVSTAAAVKLINSITGCVNPGLLSRHDIIRSVFALLVGASLRSLQRYAFTAVLTLGVTQVTWRWCRRTSYWCVLRTSFRTAWLLMRRALA